MTRAELLALGLPEGSIKEFQTIYHRDLHKAAQRMADNPERGAEELRGAIIPMVATIKSADSLRRILANVTHHYLKDYREDEKKAAQGAANTQDGKSEPESHKLTDSTPIVAGGEGGCQG